MGALNIVGGLLVAFGLFFLYLTYAIGTSGNTDQSAYGFMFIFVGVMLFALSAFLKSNER